MSRSGPLMLDIEGVMLTEEDRQLLAQPLVGGLILFSRNFENPEQLNTLIEEVRAVAPDILVAVDQEGGRVQRLKNGFTRLPPMRMFGKLAERNLEAAQSLARDCGWLMASELLATGIDLSFAPVIDLDYGNSTVIGDRAFSGDSALVSDLAGAFVDGMHSAGMAATGKHFPGHGYVAADSHIAIPRDNRNLEEIRDQDLMPFKALIDAGLDAVMPAHVIYPMVAPEPAGFSSMWLQRVLRGELGFEGVVFSDDLCMQGASIAGNYGDRARAALTAGCDMVLVCNDREAAKIVLSVLEEEQALLPDRDRLPIMRARTSSQDAAEASKSDRAYALRKQLAFMVKE